MVGLDRAVLGGDGGALDERQQVALHPLAGDIAAARVGFGADLVDLVEKDDAVLFDGVERGAGDGLIIQELVGLLADQEIVAVGDGDALGGGAVAERLAEDIAEVHHPHLAAGLAGNVHRAQWVGGVGDLDLDLGVVEQAIAEFLAEHLAGAGPGVFACDGGDDAFLGGLLGAGFDVLAHVVAGLDDGAVDEIADDLFDVAAHVADLGELGGLDLDEGGAGEFGEAAGDLGLADAGGADHQDVLGVNLVAQVVGQLLAAPAVAQGDGGGALGVLLADDETVKLADDFAGGQVGHLEMLSTVSLPLV